jgi:hypothetical protein
MMPKQEVEIYEPGELERQELTVDQLLERQAKIHEAMDKAMKVGVHYGRIPGTGQKPTLFKAGAETLCSLFMFDPEYESETSFDDEGRFHVKSKATLYHIPSGKRVASGEGYCSTGEKKYVKQGNSPDLFNTIVKMAGKRALVAAVLNATAASDAFTQDLEDMQPAQPTPAPIKAATKADLAREVTLLAYAPETWREEQVISNARASFGRDEIASFDDLYEHEGQAIIEGARRWRLAHPPVGVTAEEEEHLATGEGPGE